MLKRLLTKSIVLFVFILLCSCNIVTTPNPVVGYYKIPTPGVTGAYSYAFALYDDGTYDMIQYSETAGYITSGKYELSISSFDFESATGEITFTVEEQQEGLHSYCFTKDVDNVFIFEWDASNAPSCSLSLDYVRGGNPFPGSAISMLDSEFSDELKRWQDNPDISDDSEEPESDEVV